MDYEEALIAMHWLLETVGEYHWSQWIREDLELWRGSRQAEHHLSAYGGMGSFNDVSICAANGHLVTRESEPWAQETFDALKTICYRLAHIPGREIPCGTVRLLLRSGKPRLQGRQCTECGYREITPEELESYVAKRVTPAALSTACRNGNLQVWMSAALAGAVPGASTERNRVIDLLANSKIVVPGREGLLRPCPACKGNDTVVSYWREGMTTRGRRFVPAAGNSSRC
jgi:Zn ribbon nucleic-acid-binding protein